MHKIVRYAVIAAVILLGLIAVVAAQNIQSGSAQKDSADVPVSPFAQVIGGDEAGLRELLSRIISSSDPSPDQSVVYVGQLPDNLLFDLPLPKNARTIGSIFYGSRGYTEGILDVPQAPDEVVQFFRDFLSTGDWSALSADAIPVAGFVSQPWSEDYFCYQENQAMLRVTAQGTEAFTNVILHIFAPADSTPCGGAGTVFSPGEPYALLPQLQTPDGVTILPNSAGIQNPGAVEHAYTGFSAMLSSKLPVSKIADAYNEQLKDASWHLVGQEVGDKMAWSGWTVQGANGKTWTGMFVLIPNPAVEDQYAAQVMVGATPTEP